MDVTYIKMRKILSGGTLKGREWNHIIGTLNERKPQIKKHKMTILFTVFIPIQNLVKVGISKL